MKDKGERNDDGGAQGRGVAGEFLDCLTLATGFCLAFVKLLYGSPNRQMFLWEREDTVALFADIALLACVLLALHRLGARLLRGRWPAVLRILFPAALLAVGIQAYPLPRPYGFLWGCVLALGVPGLAAASFLRAPGLPGKFLRFFRALYFVLFAGLLAFPPLHPSDGEGAYPPPPEGGGTEGPAGPVLVVFFDAVDCGRVMDQDGAWTPELPCLHAMSRESVSFTGAVSGGINTFPSMPAFVFQAPVPAGADPDAQLDWSDDCLAWRGNPPGEDLFGMAAEAGYATGLVSCYIPWKQILPTLPDRLFSPPIFRYDRSGSFAARMANAAVLAFLHARGQEFLSFALPHNGWWLVGLRRAGVTLDGLAEMRLHAETMPPGTFCIMHTTATHDDVFMPDGEPRWGASTEGELRFADARWAEIAGVLKARGLYDRAWILVTSDHDHSHTGRHVPLMIKPPGGLAEPLVAGGVVRLWDMKKFFRAVFAGKPPRDCFAELGVPLPGP